MTATANSEASIGRQRAADAGRANVPGSRRVVRARTSEKAARRRAFLVIATMLGLRSQEPGVRSQANESLATRGRVGRVSARRSGDRARAGFPARRFIAHHTELGRR